MLLALDLQLSEVIHCTHNTVQDTEGHANSQLVCSNSGHRATGIHFPNILEKIMDFQDSPLVRDTHLL